MIRDIIKIFKGGTLLTLCLIILNSCDGFHDAIVPVNFSVEKVPTALVINGQLEKDQRGWVQISYTTDIDAAISTPTNFEKNAKVKLKTADGKEEIFKYAENGIYYGSSIVGEVNKSYTMSIEIDGKVYSANSTMFAPPGYQSAWVNEKTTVKGGVNYASYDGEWIVNDPSKTRNRYLFQWIRNGVHEVRRDWCIDDDRVVNVNEGLRLFNPTARPLPNEVTTFRAAEIDKLTYDYYNMYEKIMRGLVSVASQTPYNPVSNFGQGTIGNFRAVAYSSISVLTPPSIAASTKSGSIEINFASNVLFKKYNLYWGTSAGISKSSNVIKNINFIAGKDKSANNTYTVPNLKSGSLYYFRIETEDGEGNVSVLSPEISVK